MDDFFQEIDKVGRDRRGRCDYRPSGDPMDDDEKNVLGNESGDT